MVSAGEHHADQAAILRSPEDRDRTVLAEMRVLFEGHPGPHDLPGIGISVHLGGVLPGDRPAVGMRAASLGFRLARVVAHAAPREISAIP